MTALVHLEPDFKPIFAIQAVNEPIQDATKTPGLQDCEYSPRHCQHCHYSNVLVYEHFVQAVRVTELALGIIDPSADQLPGFFSLCGSGDLQVSINAMVTNDSIDVEVQVALKDALRILIDLAAEPGLDFPLLFEPVNRAPLTVK